ncbi:MAG: dienelactone hydrolase family protein [Phycisphaeraceae bacterium]|nr:dienelactone hydrolase family protein [Phycisphaeraceae bacterium]
MHAIIRTILGVTLGAALAPASASNDAGAPGPYPAGRTRVTVTRPDTTTFTALLYYPATAPGNGTPFDPSGAPYRAISFGHGFLQQPTMYDSTLRHLATHGYFAIATESYTGFSPNHSKYADDMLYCLTWLENASDDQNSPYYNTLDTEAGYGLTGHSMGGGASILAAARDARVRALAPIAAAETSPSAIAQMDDLTIPVSLISGSQDTITPPSQHQIPMYNAGNAPKQLPMLLGGSHCGFMDSYVIFCDSGSLPRAQQLELTRRLLVEFFDLHLREDQSRWRAVWGPDAGIDARVDLSRLKSGIVVTPDSPEAAIRAGATTALPFTIANDGHLSAAFIPVVESSPWPAGAEPAQTDETAPGQSAAAIARFSPPSDAAGQTAGVLLTSRWTRDHGTRGWSAVTVAVRCPSDWNLDGVVNTLDFLAFLNQWADAHPDADFNGDGSVNTLDMLSFLNAYNEGC